MAIFLVNIPFFISHVPPAHSFFKKKSILKNLCQICGNLFFAAYYVGNVSGRKVADKVRRTGWTAVKGEKVNAPVFTDFPMTLECRVARKIDPSSTGFFLVGDILAVRVNEEYLSEDGLPDVGKMKLIVFDPVHHGYIQLGDKVGQAFSEFKKLG